MADTSVVDRHAALDLAALIGSTCCMRTNLITGTGTTTTTTWVRSAVRD
jgi:hypothetical protein